MQTAPQHRLHATPLRKPRLRLINPNSPLSSITIPGVIRHMTFSRKALFAPTGLMICAAVTPRHWDVELVDECTREKPHEPRPDVDVVGISAMTTQARRAYALADAYRQLGVTVILGGIHPSALPEEALQHADVVCKGDAESTLPHVLADWEASGAMHGDPRRGLRRIYDWAQFEAAPIATPRKDLIEPGDYLVANPIQTTRGCPHTCNFCTTPGVFGRKFRQRRVSEIVDEIAAASARRKAWCYIFADDNFGGNQAWAMELCDALRPLKISWATQCDILVSRNDKLLRAMRDSGCVGLILGLESPRQDTLNEAGKKFVQTDTYDTRIRKIQRFGISLWGAFIFGFDNDTWQDCRAAVDFAERTRLAMSCFPILTPYPGTVFFEQFAREGRIRTLDWDRYNGASVVYEPRKMTAKELRHAQMAAFARFFSVRSAGRRLGVYPLKARAWTANLAIWKGIRYYYGKKRRRVPAFADFEDRSSPAWDYLDEPWSLAAADQESAARRIERELEQIAARTIAASDPLHQAAVALKEVEQALPRPIRGNP